MGGLLAKENVLSLSIVQYHQTSLTCLTTSHISTRLQSPSPNDEAQRVSVEAEGVALGGVEGAPAQTLPETREAPLVRDPQHPPAPRHHRQQRRRGVRDDGRGVQLDRGLLGLRTFRLLYWIPASRVSCRL